MAPIVRVPARGRAAARRFSFAIMAAGSVGVAGYAIYAYGFRPLGSLVHPDMRAAFEANRLAVYAHIFGAMVTLLLGPWQFLPAIRRRWRAAHRWMGRAYLGLGVLVGGGAGLILSFSAFGGLPSRIGFATLAVAFLLTGAAALSAILDRDAVAHRRWMVRNFALALAAVTLRIQLGLGAASGIPFEVYYPWLAWTSWLPNLVAAEVFLWWRSHRAHHATLSTTA
ncbi:MAG: DUF2306 domain-containing protein [Planctomycetota bacterium]